MELKQNFSRRNFIRTGVLSGVAVAGIGNLSSCNMNAVCEKKKPFPVFNNENFNPKDGVAGLLYSQIGYEPGLPVRILVRLPKKDFLPEKVACVLIPTSEEKQHQTGCIYWGEIWKSHWWVAEFPGIVEEGEWDIEIREGGNVVFRDSGLLIKSNILWDSTIEWSSVDMLERRRHFTGVGAGWQDAGTLWVESPAQSSMIIALEELLEKRKDSFDRAFEERIYEQIICGCDYLVLTRERADKLGFEKGAMSHDVLKQEKDILPHDASKAVVALMKAASLLPASYSEKKLKYEMVAKDAFQWLVNKAKPMGDYGFVRLQRGISNETVIPKNEWPTRDLVTMLRASMEMMKIGEPGAEALAFSYARQIMARQIPKGKSIEGFYGNFYEFESLPHAEPSWTHGIVPAKDGVQFGTDMGGIYPNYLIPVIELLELFPDHKDAETWRKCIDDFTYGYLIPACEANPFYLVPQGIFEKEGPVWFCGTFHGTNCIYGYTAALALDLMKLIDESKLKEIAYANLQWLAGLNAGITKASIEEGCVVFTTDVPEGVALPVSMICHIGKRWAGTWFQTRGVICNGFSTGEQFKYDVEPKVENDGPFSFTDEDWIPHSAGWLTGLMRF
jgi:hypothetical protein